MDKEFSKLQNEIEMAKQAQSVQISNIMGMTRLSGGGGAGGAGGYGIYAGEAAAKQAEDPFITKSRNALERRMINRIRLIGFAVFMLPILSVLTYAIFNRVWWIQPASLERGITLFAFHICVG